MIRGIHLILIEPSPLLPIASLVELSLPLGSPLAFVLKASGSANK